jgi:hypothetical protein
VAYLKGLFLDSEISRQKRAIDSSNKTYLAVFVYYFQNNDTLGDENIHDMYKGMLFG